MKQYSLFPEDGERPGSKKGVPGRGAGRNPFLLVPWNQDFLEALLAKALEDCEGDLARAVFIFPHSRPEKYLTRLLGHFPGLRLPLILPRFYTSTSLFSLLARNISGLAAWEAGLLDRVGLLLECVRAETADAGLFMALPGVEASGRGASTLDDARLFFPWGTRLSSLFEECFSQARIPRDFHYVEDQVSPFAARLLERLSGIFARYENGLKKREWTTPGRNAALVAEHLAGGGALPGFSSRESLIYIAGFHSLSGTEDRLFKHLWQEQGARILLHADPGLLEGGGHWSCETFMDWAGRWRTGIDALPFTKTASTRPSGPSIRYVEGFDLHSQLVTLQNELQPPPLAKENGGPDTASAKGGESRLEKGENGAAGKAPPDGPANAQEGEIKDASLPAGYAADTAVILPDTGLLMPVLHHLPHTDINISMGYPLTRSPLFRLIDTIFRLQENKKEHGYYWRDIVELVRHPYLKMLVPADRKNPAPPEFTRAADGVPGTKEAEKDAWNDESSSLRREFGRFEHSLRAAGASYPDPFALLREMRLEDNTEELPSPEVAALVENALAVTLSAFENPARPKDLGKALEGLCDLLLAHGEPLWDRFLIDAECLYRLMQSVIPELTRSALAEESFTPATLFVLARQLLDAERVPFEAMPLVGLQVMGLLESRLLRFRRVFMVDATEDRLPGSPNGDPLLPDALRPELGLPGPHARERVFAYHFFRLLAGAEEVVLLWQEAPEAPGVQDGKKKKSRFVEELLWREEQNMGRLLRDKGRDGPLETLSASVAPLVMENGSLPSTPAIKKLVEDMLKRPVSASLLDGYLRCPLQFFYERVSGLAPAREITEGEDPLSVGTVLHGALQEYYSPRLGLLLPAGAELGPQELEHNHQELLEALRAQAGFDALRRNSPADAFAMLEAAAGIRLREYLLKQPGTQILALETPLRASFYMDGQTIGLTGTADRIDLRRTDLAPGATVPPKTGPDAEPGKNTNNAFQLHILDYKSGRPAIPTDALWSDERLWRAMETWQPEPAPPGESAAQENASLLQRLSERLGSIQLPLYLYLVAAAYGEGVLSSELLTGLDKALAKGGCSSAGEMERFLSGTGPGLFLNAAWVPLGIGGEEKPLFKAGTDAQTAGRAIREQVPGLLYFLLRHLRESNTFSPHPGPHCRWCFYKNSCNVSVLS